MLLSCASKVIVTEPEATTTVSGDSPYFSVKKSSVDEVVMDASESVKDVEPAVSVPETSVNPAGASAEIAELIRRSSPFMLEAENGSPTSVIVPSSRVTVTCKVAGCKVSGSKYASSRLVGYSESLSLSGR